MKVAIRADAALGIGLGHIRRCLSLAHAFRDLRAVVRFFTWQVDVDVRDLVRAHGFDVTRLGQGAAPGEVADGALFLDHAAPFRPERIVVDHYGLSAAWHSMVRSAGLQPLAAIDDIANRALDVDLLVDPNLCGDHRAKYGVHIGPKTKILGGPRFALLGPSYADAPRYVPRPSVEGIGIFMGGTDEANLTEVAMDACRHNLKFSGSIEIVTTRHNPHLAALRARVSTEAPTTTLHIDQPDLVRFFARNDLQVGAGGGATWERCCIGAPTVVVIAAANQRPSLGSLKQLGAAAPVFAEPPTSVDIAQALEPLIRSANVRESMSAAAQRVVDGQGAKRVADAVVSL